MNIPDRLIELRGRMEALGIAACIVPSGDPHLGEYIAGHWKIREWLSGFTGSSGTLVVTSEEAGLWTDSRYFLQAEKQLSATDIHLFKSGMPGVPGYAKWLKSQLLPGDKVGVNGAVISLAASRGLARDLSGGQIQLVSTVTLAEDIWNDRPPLPDNMIFAHDETWAGISRGQKLSMIRERMRHEGATCYITAALDEVAWALNLRGADVEYNPLFYSFLVVGIEHARLFVNPHKLTAAVARDLTIDNISVHHYNHFIAHLGDYSPETDFLIDPKRINSLTYAALPRNARKIERPSVIAGLKAVKNDAEIKNLKDTMVNDGIAFVEFLIWLEQYVPKGHVTEMIAASRLKSLRAARPGFQGESFATISAFGANGAIVHYNAVESSNAKLEPGGLYLIDSGGHYLGGTTDFTRVVAFGKAGKQERIDYTMVLKAHVALATAVFPAGTPGVALDAIARKPLWENKLNYGHGTGHGVGYFLNVHEGPQTISQQPDGAGFEPGMVTTNEPGIYRPGLYGIRIENMLLCKEMAETDFGKFLEFETLTQAPIDTYLIEPGMLSANEISWVNNYNQNVYNALAPHLDEKQKGWLKTKTSPLKPE